ncbi:MAG: tetratricopeptide repeat protein [Deltaproteobacteria bacterium]|nr:tetratricopeptide repeat protein [Deltaproteobacteria bacterium]
MANTGQRLTENGIPQAPSWDGSGRNVSDRNAVGRKAPRRSACGFEKGIWGQEPGPGSVRSRRVRPWLTRWSLLLAATVLPPASLLAQGEAPAPPAVRVADTGGLETSTAALILSGQQGGELGVSVQAIPLPGDGVKKPVSLWVEMEAASLLEGHTSETLIAEIYAYALDPDGGIGGFLTQAIAVNLEQAGRRLLEAGGIKFVGQLELEPDSYTLQVLVRQRSSKRFSLQSKPITVPASTTAPPAELIPIFPSDGASWLLVNQATKDEQPVSLPPWNLGGQGGIPSTFPVIHSGRPASFFVAATALEGELKAHLLTLSDRQSIFHMSLVRRGEAVAGPEGLNLFPVELPATGVRPGQYFLELRGEVPEDPLAEVKRKEGLDVSEVPPEPLKGAISIVVLPAEFGSQLPVWTQLRTPAPLPEDTEIEELSNAERRRAMTLERWMAAYAEALLDPKFENAPPASLLLTRMEHSQLSGEAAKRRGGLSGVDQVDAALELAREHPEILVPLVRFHANIYRRHHRNKNYLLARHSRGMAYQLANSYVELSGSEGARRIAAANLVSIGGYLQKIGSVPGARNAFEVALEYDPDDQAALLGLGVILESYSEYEAAAAILEHLVEVRPKMTEARLRLAVNLQRIGKSKQARRLFERVLETGTKSWVRVVAYQQMASLLSMDKKVAEAIEVLQSAISEFPGQQRIYIQLAASFDAIGRPAAAREVLSRLDAKVGTKNDSPRLTYGSKPTWTVRQSRRFIDETSGNRLPLLTESLNKYLEGPEPNAEPGS